MHARAAGELAGVDDLGRELVVVRAPKLEDQAAITTEPWERLMRATSMPARTRPRTTSGSSVAGPRLATSFVLRMRSRLLAPHEAWQFSRELL